MSGLRLTDPIARGAAVALTALALLFVLVDAPSIVRVPTILAFALLAPGLAVTRFVPTLTTIDRLALSAAVSLSLNIVLSLGLVAIEEWSGEPVLAALAAITLGCALSPRVAPWREHQARTQRERNEQIRARRHAQEHAYDLVMSQHVNERRRGLIALSWLLDDDARTDEAARLRSLSALPVPPLLPLRPPEPTADAVLRDAHVRARSEDPETRRRGLLEVAELLDTEGRNEEAATLRGLVVSDNPPNL